MNREIKYLIIATLLFIFAIVISGCSEFEQKFTIVPGHQLNCSPSASPGCTGWNSQ